MRRFVAGAHRGQPSLSPFCVDKWVDADSPVRVSDAFVDALDFAALGFAVVKLARDHRTNVDLRVKWTPVDRTHGVTRRAY